MRHDGIGDIKPRHASAEIDVQNDGVGIHEAQHAARSRAVCDGTDDEAGMGQRLGEETPGKRIVLDEHHASPVADHEFIVAEVGRCCSGVFPPGNISTPSRCSRHKEAL